VWPEEEVEQLRALYEEYKNSVEEGKNNCQGTGVLTLNGKILKES